MVDLDIPRGRSAPPTALPLTGPVARQIGAPLAVVAIILVAVGLRPSIVSVGPVLPLVIQDFGLSHATASLLTSIPDVLMGLFALPTPWLARRFGRDPVLLMALALLCFATFARSFATSTAGLLAATAAVGIGIAVAGALIAGFIKARFAARAAMMMGIYATALSTGSTISAAVTSPVAIGLSAGWRWGLGLWSGVVLAGVAIWLVVTVAERRQNAVVPAAAARHALPWRSVTAWLVALFFGGVNILFYTILAWTAPMYQEAGVSAATAGLILATFTAVFTVANPVFGGLSRSEDRRAWLALAAGLTLAGLAALALAPTTAPFLWMSVCAFGLGGTFTLGMTLPLDNTASPGEANSWNAFVLLVGYVIAAAGPLVAGQLRDVTGNFHLSQWLLAAIAALMLAVTPFLKPLRRHGLDRP
ncbi:CynX/NimT family MFS transporter [Inquilinus limosus]|uniref:MFS transporter n=1 Tax=Inquilinus limosus TaxID=171674 RepID=UPI001C52E0F9|nr:MFS transporter [Inquilinus limosus]